LIERLVDVKREYYDYLVGASRDFHAQTAFLDSLFKKYQVKSALDCGCGTGTHAVLLAKKGYEVTAFDFSKHQVTLAKKKANANNARIKFHVGDIRRFDFGRFDALISLFAPIMFACKNKKELKSALKCMKDSLKPRGICFFETCTPRMLEGPRTETKEYSCPDFKVKRAARYKFNRINKSAEITYVETLEKGGKITKQTSRATHMYFDRETIENALRELGIKHIRFYSYFDSKKGKYLPFNQSSAMISVLFRKTK